MKKKIIYSLLALSIVFVCFLGFLNISLVKAADYSTELLKTVSVLGVGVIQSGSMQLKVVDMTNATGNQFFNLPDASTSNGVVYVVKRNGGSSDYALEIDATSTTNLIDGGHSMFLMSDGDVAIFAADSTNGTWWMIGKGTPQY